MNGGKGQKKLWRGDYNLFTGGAHNREFTKEILILRRAMTLVEMKKPLEAKECGRKDRKKLERRGGVVYLKEGEDNVSLSMMGGTSMRETAWFSFRWEIFGG